MTRREALILLNLTGMVGSAGIDDLTEAFGSAEAAVGRSERELEAAGLAPAAARRAALLRREDLDRELRKAERAGVRIITIDDAEYPRNLRNIFSPPIVLYARGGFLPDDALAVAIVGSRAASLYGLSTAGQFASGLAEKGFTVVSGLARGIDTAAHTGALGRGRTIAVIGGGFNRLYPPENRGLAETIAGEGCVASEFAMDTPPSRTTFPRRNRIISGLSLGVLVVEAGRSSGSLITAAFALEQGRDVFAVPGRLDSRGSRGSNALIREGAALVSCVEDITEEFPFAVPARGMARGLPAAGRKKPLRGEEKTVYAIISGEGASLDELVQRSGMGICRLSAVLLKMQLARLIRKLPGNRFARN